MYGAYNTNWELEESEKGDSYHPVKAKTFKSKIMEGMCNKELNENHYNNITTLML